jgi:hypothetical protein
MDGEALMFFCSTDAGIVMGFNGRPCFAYYGLVEVHDVSRSTS